VQDEKRVLFCTNVKTITIRAVTKIVRKLRLECKNGIFRCSLHTTGDVMAAKDGKFGKPKEAKGVAWWDYRKDNGVQHTNIPLPSLLSGQHGAF
jgi:hypothetical protein